MLRDGNFNRIIICCGRTDLRRGASGLAAYVEVNYGLNAFEKGTLFLFCGRRSSVIKGICFEGIGMATYTLRLAKGNSFQWPRTTEEARAVTPEQYLRLMQGFSMEGTIREVYPKKGGTTDAPSRQRVT